MSLALWADARTISDVPTQPFHVQRNDMDVDALEVVSGADCLLALEGSSPTYASATFDGLCVASGHGYVDKVVQSLSVLVFGSARTKQRSNEATDRKPYEYDTLIDQPFKGYSATGRLLWYSDDVGMARSFGSFWLDAHDPSALLRGMTCDATWRGGPTPSSLSLINTTCRYFGDIGGVRLFLTFKTSVSSIAPIERVLNAVVAKLQSD